MEQNIRHGVALTRLPPLLPFRGIDLRYNAYNRVPIRRLLFQERLIPAQSCQDFGAQPDYQVMRVALKVRFECPYVTYIL